MNTLVAKVVSIKEVDSLHLIGFDVLGQSVTMISLGLNLPIKVDCQVRLGFKSLAVTLGKDLSGDLSTSNQLVCEVQNITEGELLSNLDLTLNDTVIQSVITTNSVQRMKIKKGDKVTALIKANELSVLEVLS